MEHASPTRITALEPFLDSLSTAVVAIDRNGIIFCWNKRAEQVFQIDRKAVLGCYIPDVLPGAGEKLVQCVESRTVFRGERLGVETNRLTAHMDPLVTGNVVVGAVGFFHEGWEIERVSCDLEACRSLAKQLDAIIQSSYDGLWVCDGEGVVIRINKASERLNRIDAKKYVGRKMDDLVREGFIDKSTTLEVLQTGRSVTMYQEVKGEGKMVTSNPVFDEKGEISLVVTNERDVTEIERLAAQLEATQEISDRYCSELQNLNLVGADGKRIVARSEKMREVLGAALRVATVDTTVLLLGESGVGKSMIAKFIHRGSERKDRAFVQVNCGALPESLLESELFGYERGAFTGANSTGKAGLFEVAAQGTLFLDEIGDLTLNTQSKLLRFLDDKAVIRLGGTRETHVDARIITATNRGLEALVSRGSFREDLYYRLKTFPMRIPPLRERKEDILPLIQFYLDDVNQRHGMDKSISGDVLRVLLDYSFPGNVRELASLIENLALIAEGPRIGKSHLPHYLQADGGRESRETSGSLRAMLEKYESKMLEEAVAHYPSTRKIAKALGTSHSTIVRRLRKYGLQGKG